jgi:hypothetical protein
LDILISNQICLIRKQLNRLVMTQRLLDHTITLHNAEITTNQRGIHYLLIDEFDLGGSNASNVQLTGYILQDISNYTGIPRCCLPADTSPVGDNRVFGMFTVRHDTVDSARATFPCHSGIRNISKPIVI